MENKLKVLSPVIFILIIIFFFLPFVSYSCSGPMGELEIATASGFDFILGSELKLDEEFSKKMTEGFTEGLNKGLKEGMEDGKTALEDKTPKTVQPVEVEKTDTKTSGKNEKLDISIFAIVAFVCAILGLLLSFGPIKKTGMIIAIVAIVGFVGLLLFQGDASGALEGKGEAEQMKMITVNYQITYWLSLALFIVAAVLYFLGYMPAKKSPVMAEPVAYEPPPEE